jgi:hypothetical protein
LPGRPPRRVFLIGVWEEHCGLCWRAAVVREWAERPGWLEVDCPACGPFRVERRFWVAAHLKKARSPVAFRGLVGWLAEHRQRDWRPEIPFDDWEGVVPPPGDR